ncbi:sulfoxide reductase heme-binding subunit YedZ [Novosphingobium sp. FSY-8]|uniref:Protein-methionine-sulfoxide reductase heme-binding subunit MsrQ n=2 Tax=Novosphingobium ovatum TaxID=1908523 RepID=A0ABW9XDP7_9SPHN|nr:sulfoxide reductase heme-binding subunit YedZ [Novosphingobium ovatum]
MALPLAVLVARWGAMAWGLSPRAAGLTAEPVAETINQLGLWALRALWLTLAVTPLRAVTGWNWLAAWRRPLGLWCFAYATLHLMVYVGLDMLGDLGLLWADVVKHRFILLGMAGWVMLLPLALTSPRAVARWLGGRRWRVLHRLAYVAGLAVAVHFLLRVKGFQIEPWIYAGLLALLLGLRRWPARAIMHWTRPRA